jgi:diguanylate cyclase (GGDEF)-like protein
VQGQSLYQLISPLIFLAFSCGFAVLWLYARDVTALRYYAASYFLGSCAFVGNFLRPLMPPVVEIYATSPFYIGMTVLFCGATFVFYRGRAPWKTFWLIGAAMLALISWFSFAANDIVSRAMVMHAGVFAMMVYTAVSLHRDMTRRIDRVLQAIIVISAIQLVCRGAYIVFYAGSSLTQADFPQSILALLLHFSVSIVALALALCLFVMFGMKIVARLTLTSHTDPLTGALNRRGFEAQLAALADEEAMRSSRHAVVMADLDRFKSVNDTFGHEAGDAVIRAFARMLGSAARECDFVVRWGGEEFLIVIAHADTATAHLFAETVRTAQESIPHDCLNGESVTASFGIAAWHGEQSLSNAIRNADMTLYRAKHEGRNRVYLHSSGFAGKPSAIA